MGRLNIHFANAKAFRIGTRERRKRNCASVSVSGINEAISVNIINGLHGECFKQCTDRVSNSTRRGVLTVRGAVRGVANCDHIYREG